MSNSTDLGRLVRIDLRTIWENEATDFTPWLSREENLAFLADTLGIEELALESREKAVGPLSADILCRDTVSDSWVLIENQLEPTDHKHLGQLLTYASGLHAQTIVWVAREFTEEHRAALDWLNRITGKGFNFFGLEIELWQIGGSPAAPKFNIVAKPNDWSRSVRQEVRDPSPLEQLRAEYWAELNEVLAELNGPVSSRKPPFMGWPAIRWGIGRSAFNLAAVHNSYEPHIRAELYLSGPNAKAFFHLLFEQREQMEPVDDTEFPELEWEELPDAQASRIAVYLRNVDITDKADWPQQHGWLASQLNDLHQRFADRVRALKPEEWEGNSADSDVHEIV